VPQLRVKFDVLIVPSTYSYSEIKRNLVKIKFLFRKTSRVIFQDFKIRFSDDIVYNYKINNRISFERVAMAIINTH
jgi:hypothetical protein